LRPGRGHDESQNTKRGSLPSSDGHKKNLAKTVGREFDGMFLGSHEKEDQIPEPNGGRVEERGGVKRKFCKGPLGSGGEGMGVPQRSELPPGGREAVFNNFGKTPKGWVKGWKERENAFCGLGSASIIHGRVGNPHPEGGLFKQKTTLSGLFLKVVDNKGCVRDRRRNR